jgi:hypothetical protein
MRVARPRIAPLLAWLFALALGARLPAHAEKAEPKKEGRTEKEAWDVQKPPGKSHDVPIDVTEGTWISLDVSPDGQEIVFDLLGDLYTIPIEGGEARPLTAGLAWDMQPRYSPDGGWIAFGC